MSLQRYGIITGAGASIGRETCFTFAEGGSEGIIVAGRTMADLEATAEESRKYAKSSSFRVIPMQVDVTERGMVREMVAAAIREFGRLDFVVHSAGVANAGPPSKPLGEMTDETFEAVTDINVRGTFNVTSEAIRAMKNQDEVFTTGRGGRRSVGRGVIVNLSSIAGMHALPGGGAYTPSKFAVIGLTNTAVVENARNLIRVNTVCPSWCESRMLDRMFENRPGYREMVAATVPAGRPAKTEEVAEVIHFLCSNSASFVNGVTIPVDAGWGHTRGF